MRPAKSNGDATTAAKQNMAGVALSSVVRYWQIQSFKYCSTLPGEAKLPILSRIIDFR